MRRIVSPWAHPRSRGENVSVIGFVRCFAGSSPLTRGKQASVFLGIAWSGLIPAHAGKTSSRGTVRPRGRAHPRSRGENLRARSAGRRIEGSSPLTRGKPGHDAPAADCGRLIPAHAGKTRRTQGAGGRVGAHPRSRGENSHAATMTDESKGSSPLTRGKLRVLKLPLPARGLIPAHAGKTAVRLAFPRHTRAHPRSRGENSASTSAGV